VEALSLRSSFPQLLELERSRGSVVLGMFAAQTQKGARGSRVGELLDLARWMRRHEQAHSPFLSLRRGMGSLPEALAAALPAGAVHTNAAVEGLVPPTSARGPWRTRLASGAELESEVVIVTTPAHVASRVLPDAALAKELARIPYVSTATVFFALDRARVSHPLNGVGFVVPKGEGRILAATWVNSKWEHRAPDGSVLVRAFLGGARERSLLQTHGDPALAELARTELERVMGPLGPALFTRVFRYTDSNPQPVLGHAGRVARIQAAAGRLPRFALAGAAFDGVGIPDCVRQAKEAATRALDQC
jgi:oxygen-dependent protoporphyrinogen oxidase